MRAGADSLLAALPGETVALDGERVLWRSADGVRREILTPGEQAVLGVCETFAPPAMHLERIVARFNCAPAEARQAFEALVARDLICDPERILGKLDAGAAPLAPEPLIVIRSFQRPEGLRRLLASLLADERHHAVQRRYAIVDDTLDPAFAAQTRQIVTAFARESTSCVALLGMDERGAALARLLEGHGGETRRALLEMLDPAHPTAVTGSRTWNWAVLLAAGGTLSILDDDTTFPVRLPDNTRAAIDLADANEPVVRFYDDDEGLSRLSVAPADPYGHLREWVGQPVQHLLHRHGYRSAFLLHRSPRELAHLRSGMRVLGAVPGTYGTIPLDSSVYLTYLTQVSQENLWRAPYRHGRLAADNVWQGYEAPRLTSFAVYTPLLLDDRELLPFAGTWGRVDDTYFLMLVRAIAEDAAFAHVPALLGHADHAPRRRLERALEPLPLDRNAFVARVIAHIGQGLKGQDRATRLGAVGAVCETLAAAADASLRDDVLRWRAGMRARVTTHLAGALKQHHDAPALWREHAAKIVAVNCAASVDDEVTADELGRYRAALVQIARVAPHWPALWARAAELGVERLAVDAKPL